MLEDFDTLAEHAKKLGKSKRTLQRWASQPNGLPRCKRGRELLFREDWTRAWFEQGKIQRNPTKTRHRTVKRRRRLGGEQLERART
jgi:hypothetical protein